MSLIDGFLIVFMLLIFAAVLGLTHQRQNGYINQAPPEPTVKLQLEKCGNELEALTQKLEARDHQLATANQTVDVWRTLATRQKVIIEELSQALENHE